MLKHNVNLNPDLHKTLVDPFEKAHPLLQEPQRILQRADLVWSRMILEKDEVLFVKVALAAASHAEEIAALIDRAFGPRKEQVLVYVEGTLDITKVAKP